MGKQTIYRSDLNDTTLEFQLKVFHSDEDTLRLFIEELDDDNHACWIDFNKETAEEFIKDLQKIIKDM